MNTYSEYTCNIGNAMVYEWWKGNRRKYFQMQKYLHMSITGSKNKKAWGAGPFPTRPQRNKV